MAELKPYLKYKNSGIAWIGDVPEGWGLASLRSACSKIGSGKTPTGGGKVYKETGILFIRSQNVYDDGLRLNDVVYIDRDTDIEMANSRVFGGDILLNVTGASIGRTCIVPQAFQPANVNQHVCIIRVKNEEYKHFIALYMKSALAKWHIGFLQNGAGREGLNFEQIGNFKIPIPSHAEQQAIAAFLDRETGHIDTLIEKKQRSIELLKEKRQATITHAVTKGLDANAPMKDSGIEWIGEIPTRWKLLTFGRVATVKQDLVNPLDYLDSFQIAPEHIEKNTGRLLELKTVHEASVISNNNKFHAGDILYCKIRPSLNKVIIAPCDGICSAEIYPLQTSENTRYIFYQILSKAFLEQVTMITMTRVKMPKVNQLELSKIFVTRPPLQEQQAIADYLDTQCAKIDDLITKTQRSIELLKEKRQSLITAAVTGKIDVREAVC